MRDNGRRRTERTWAQAHREDNLRSARYYNSHANIGFA
jgi:hypothetical protein